MEALGENSTIMGPGSFHGLKLLDFTESSGVVRGEVFDVAVDIRKGSPTFGQWEGVILSEENKRQFWVPPGFAHGFVVLSDTADFEYKCTDYYDPSDEGSLAWNDPDVNIDWPLDRLDGEPQLSGKDQDAGSLADLRGDGA